MTGIFFGGVATDEPEANALAKRCVSATQGGTAIVRICEIVNDDLIGAKDRLLQIFDMMSDRMYENELTISTKTSVN